MEILYSHGDLLTSPSDRLSPKLPQAQGILHNLSLQPTHNPPNTWNLNISWIWVVSLKFWQCSGPKADALFLLLFCINASLYLVCIPVGASSLGI